MKLGMSLEFNGAIPPNGEWSQEPDGEEGCGRASALLRYLKYTAGRGGYGSRVLKVMKGALRHRGVILEERQRKPAFESNTFLHDEQGGPTGRGRSTVHHVILQHVFHTVHSAPLGIQDHSTIEKSSYTPLNTLLLPCSVRFLGST